MTMMSIGEPQIPGSSTSAMAMTEDNAIPRVTVAKEVESNIVFLQEKLAQLCENYQAIQQQTSMNVPFVNFQRKLMIQQELSRLETEIRTADRLIKEEIRRGLLDTENLKNLLGLTSISFRSSSRRLPPRYGTSTKTQPYKPPDNHPSSQCEKEDFLERLGLLSYEALQLKRLQSAKVERRRRTATMNPKYSTNNGFLKIDELSTRRSKRLESSPSNGMSSTSKAISSYATEYRKFQCCFVCNGADFDLSCETCTTRFHANCIKVTASNAPTPHRLPICPKCVQAANTSQRVRMESRSTRCKPSIMRSPTKSTGSTKTDDECDSELMQDDTLQSLPVVTKLTRSNSVSDQVVKTNGNKSSNHFRHYGSSKRQIEAVGPKAKSRSIRIARVRLNMRRSSDDSRNKPSAPVKSLPATFNRMRQPVPAKQNAIKWQTKLKPKSAPNCYGRRRPIISTLKATTNPGIAVAALLDDFKPNGNSNSRQEEDEENSLQPQSTEQMVKVEKSCSDQQTPLVSKNDNPIVDEAHQSKGHAPFDDTLLMLSRPTCKNSGRKSVRKRKVSAAFSPESSKSLESDFTSDEFPSPMSEEVMSRPKPKRAKRSPKVKQEDALVVRRTVLAMTAAANAVMSNPSKLTIDEEDPWANDTVMQAISSVIAWAGCDDADLTDSSTAIAIKQEPKPKQSSPQRMAVKFRKFESKECKNEDVEDVGPPSPMSMSSVEEAQQHLGIDSHHFQFHQPAPEPEVKLEPTTSDTSDSEDEVGDDDEDRLANLRPAGAVPDNPSVDDLIEGRRQSYSDSSCSMRGQISDDDEDVGSLLSLPNSPTPSWADGDVMSRTELVEKMLLVEETSSEFKPIISIPLPNLTHN